MESVRYGFVRRGERLVGLGYGVESDGKMVMVRFGGE